MDLENISLGYKIPIISPVDKNSIIKCEVVSKKIDEGKSLFYIHYLGLNRRYDRWLDGSEFILTNPTEIEIPRKKKKSEEKAIKIVKETGVENSNFNRLFIPEDEFKIKNIDKIYIGKYLVDTWYFSPYPKEIIKNNIVYICEFCLYYFSDRERLATHCQECKLRQPPGLKIYEDDNVAFFELDGYVQKNYCRNISLISKLFLDHKSVYWDIDVFLYYVLCRKDEAGYHVVGYFSKEKVSEQGYNLACILTLPYEQRKGYGKILIDFSYMLSKKDKRIAGPEKPLSDLGLLSYRAYWLEAILEELANTKEISISGLSKKTYITEEDIIGTLVAYKMIKYYGDDLIIVLADDMINKMGKGRKHRVYESCLLISY